MNCQVSRLRTSYPTMHRRLDVVSRRAMHTELSMSTECISPQGRQEFYSFWRLLERGVRVS